MAKLNKNNPARGKRFQKLAGTVLAKRFRKIFCLEVKIPIGKPPKDHKFDLVSNDRTIVVETKNYSWTKSGNVPSAKMGFVNEAVFYLQHLSNRKERIVIMKKHFNKKQKRTLAQYYFQTNKHLLNGVRLFEIETKTKKLVKISK